MGFGTSKPATPTPAPKVVPNQNLNSAIPRQRPPMAHFGLGTIKIIMQAITKVKADVIVIPSSSEQLKTAIFDAAGDSVRNEYENKSSYGCYSDMIVLSPGTLQCKKIYVVNWTLDSDRATLEKSLQKFFHDSIEGASSYHCTSIAFPAIGCTGNNDLTSFIIPSIIKIIKDELIRISAVLSVIMAILPQRQQIFNAFKGEMIRLENQITVSQVKNPFQVPATWTQPQGAELRFEVSSGTNEYDDILKSFNATMTGHYRKIIMIERIQNKHWYMQYAIHRDGFREKLNTDTEKRLFHGCSEDAANKIIKSWFNRGFAGIHGIVYGSGVYFSSQALYSDRYATANQKGEKRMFFARVLIGKTIRGDSSMKVAPLGYDSTTDGQHIYVTYHDVQAYGDYLITYR